MQLDLETKWGAVGGRAGAAGDESELFLLVEHGPWIGCGLEGSPQHHLRMETSFLQYPSFISAFKGLGEWHRAAPCQHSLARWHGWVPGPGLEASGPEPREASR